MHAAPPPDNVVTIDLLRHGEPEGGIRYRGTLDDPLSKIGWQQMNHSVNRAWSDGIRWDTVISSPMQRCQAFAKHASEHWQRPMVVQAGLRELGFGDLEGLTPEQAWAQYPELLENMWSDPQQHTPPNGESFTVFLQRVKNGLDHIINRYRNQHVLLVVHGGVIRAALTLLLNIAPKDTFQIQIPFAGLSRIQVFSDNESERHCSLTFLNRYTGDTEK